MIRLRVVAACRAVSVTAAAIADAGAAAVVAATAVVAVAGCAQLAGIDDTSNTGRAGDSVALTRMSIGSTVTTSPMDLTGLQATYFVASGDPSGFDRVVATAGAAAGTWSTKLRAAAPVEFTFPDVPTPIPRLYAFPSAQLSTLFGVLEHPSPMPAPDGATFTVAAPLDALPAVGDSFESYVVGAWLSRPFAAGEVVINGTQLTPPAFSFTAANSVSGRPQLDLVSQQDSFLILRRAAGALTGVAEAAPFDQTGAATTVTTGAMVPVTQDQTLEVTLSQDALTKRYTTVQPAVTLLQMAWSLVAAPGYRIASGAGPLLQSGQPQPMVPGISTPYGNPFAARGWNTMFSLTTSESRAYQLPGALTTIDLFAGMNQFIEPSPGFDMKLPAGLPIVISLAGVPLVTDGLAIVQPSKFVEVSFLVNPAPDVAGPSATVYNLQVFDLVVNPAMMPERHLTFMAASNQAKFSLPPELFQIGHSYTLRAVTTLGGFPSIDAGNFVDRTLPLAQSFLDSGVITVPAVTP